MADPTERDRIEALYRQKYVDPHSSGARATIHGMRRMRIFTRCAIRRVMAQGVWHCRCTHRTGFQKTEAAPPRLRRRAGGLQKGVQGVVPADLLVAIGGEFAAVVGEADEDVGGALGRGSGAPTSWYGCASSAGAGRADKPAVPAASRGSAMSWCLPQAALISLRLA